MRYGRIATSRAAPCGDAGRSCVTGRFGAGSCGTVAGIAVTESDGIIPVESPCDAPGACGGRPSRRPPQYMAG